MYIIHIHMLLSATSAHFKRKLMLLSHILNDIFSHLLTPLHGLWNYDGFNTYRANVQIWIPLVSGEDDICRLYVSDHLVKITLAYYLDICNCTYINIIYIYIYMRVSQILHANSYQMYLSLSPRTSYTYAFSGTWYI